MTELFTAAEPGCKTALLASRCGQCARTAFPRSGRCLACGADTEPVELTGPARLDVVTAVLSQPPGALITAPYEVGVATFEQAGLSVIGLLAGTAPAGSTVDVVVTEPYPDGRTFAFAATETVVSHQPTEKQESAQ